VFIVRHRALQIFKNIATPLRGIPDQNVPFPGTDRDKTIPGLIPGKYAPFPVANRDEIFQDFK
jgi:hypothetical protein